MIVLLTGLLNANAAQNVPGAATYIIQGCKQRVGNITLVKKEICQHRSQKGFSLARDQYIVHWC